MSRAILLALGALAVAGVVYAFLALAGGDPPLPEPEARPAVGTAAPPPPAADPDVAPGPAGPQVEEIPDYPWRRPEWKLEMLDALAKARVTLHRKEWDLGEVAAELARALGYAVTFDTSADPGARRVTVRLRDTDGLTAIRVLELRSGFVHYLAPDEIRFAAPDAVPAPEGAEAVLARIEEAKAALREGPPPRPPLGKLLPIRIADDSIWRAAKQVEARLDLPVVVEPEPDDEMKRARVTIEEDGLTAAEVLDRIAGAARLGWALDGRRIVIAELPRVGEIRERAERAARIREAEAEVRWSDLPLFRAAREIEGIAGVPVVVDRNLWEPIHPRITLRAGPHPLERILRMLDAELEAAHLVTGEGIYLVRP